MNNVCTVDLLDTGPTPETPATAYWYAGVERHPERAFNLSRMARVAGLAFSLAISSLTAIPDPWLLERKRRDATVTVSVYQQVVGRSVTRSEALRIARRILEQAEQERLAIAEFEAARGIQWGDEP